VIRVGQNKVQDQEPGADQFVGQTAAIAKIVLLDGLIEGACEEIVDQGMTSESGCPNVAVVVGFDGQARAHAPSIDPGKTEELLLGEVAGMGGDEVKEACFGRGITVPLDSPNVFDRSAHRERMACMISGSAIAGRRRTASSAKA
jgi:hypothetical protein